MFRVRAACKPDSVAGANLTALTVHRIYRYEAKDLFNLLAETEVAAARYGINPCRRGSGMDVSSRL
jgi:hypothetical protein